MKNIFKFNPEKKQNVFRNNITQIEHFTKSVIGVKTPQETERAL